ncbi:proline dehydrogenase family protein [Candidatus Palauibacter sp.]|uniref:proline dehydrogenase family protein n=1 Tax=Candidatus Palauibacter sp. TaxID=3101350 RepID=UPI003B024631
MMRRGLLWASTNPWLSTRLPERPFVRRAVRKFMPGETLEAALTEADRLGQLGVPTLITTLGENVETAEETREIVTEYVRAIEMAAAMGLDAEVSIKPTHLGLDVDQDLTLENVRQLTAHAEGRGTLWIDMEGSPYLESTLSLYRDIRSRHENVGLCLQSYLRRTAEDLESLIELGPRVRLVKGAYAEPPEIAFPAKRDVDASYVALARRLMDHLADGGDGFLGLGTHDPAMIQPLTEYATAAGLDGSQFEFEMLYGIGRREQRRLVRNGTPLRVLISYGAAWFPWYMRRLAERPANVWFVARSMFR